jgi:hypothetical protein
MNTVIDNNVESVREKLLNRSTVGVNKYGTTTDRTDLSKHDWLVHLQEELMDAIVYIEAALKPANPHIGSSFDDFLREEGIAPAEACEPVGVTELPRDDETEE